MLRLLKDIRRCERGVTMMEYALVAGLISVVSISLVTHIGSSVRNLLSSVNSTMTTA